MLKKSACGGTFSKTFDETPKILRNFRGRQAAWSPYFSFSAAC
jgi:hypothetical protein